MPWDGYNSNKIGITINMIMNLLSEYNICINHIYYFVDVDYIIKLS